MPRMMRSVGSGLLLIAPVSFKALMFSGRTLLRIFRWGIFLLACVFLYTQLDADKGTRAVQALRNLRADGTAVVLVAIAALLVVVNWGIEALKWRRLVASIQAVSLGRAFLATLAGTSVALVTPNRTGEFIGRVLFLEPGVRFSAGFATALGSIAQFVVTLVAGGAALLMLSAVHSAMPWSSAWYSVTLVSLASIVAFAALVLYLYPRLLRQLLLLLPFMGRFRSASEVLDGYKQRELLTVLGLSALRYLVFTTQFVLICTAFDIGVPALTSFMVIPVVYLASSLVPTVLLTELGVRGSAAVAFFEPLGADPVGVLLATTVVWSINLVFPAMVGSVLLLSTRIRTAE